MKTWVATAAAVLAAVLVGAPAAMAQVAFPQTPVGASSANQDIAFVNDDPDPVALGQTAVSSSDAAAFQVVVDTCAGETLGPDEECRVSVAFRATRIGTHAATLQVPVEGDPDAPFSVALSGEGIPWLRLTPSVLDFGTVAFLGPAQDVLVENVSGRETSLRAWIDPLFAGFALSRAPTPDRCGSTLAAGATCRVGVTFRPQPGVTTEARLVFRGTQTEVGSVTLRGTGAFRPRTPPIRFPTPDATAVLRKGLREALGRLRGRSREIMSRRGLIVRGIVPPAQGRLGLVVRGRRASPRRQGAAPTATLVAARRRVPVQAGQRATIRARLTRAGRRLLRSGRPLVLDVKLALVARSDDRLSEANGVLRLGRVPRKRSA
jgi:centrosomal CEP192-like protein